jgi:MoaA/NifB/PqqE/SkfB family radical SAM enzyme
MVGNKKTDYKDRMSTRERLKREKPAVYAKFLELDEKSKRGEVASPVIEIAYRYDCNLTCRHCFASRFEKKERKLSVKDITDLSLQAKDLGVYQFILQGGEPLFWDDFDEVVNAINPQEFYLGLVTNATLLNKEKIKHLRQIGIDKVVISLDSFDADQYEHNRSSPGLFNHTIDRILQAKDAGLRVVINTLATKQNVRSPQLLNLIEFAKQHDLIVYVNFAAPIGSWEGRYDLLLDQDDASYIYDLNRKHEVVKRDIFPYMGKKVGCPAFRSVVYITQYGDVLPCPFVHISFGSIFNESLVQIFKKGMRLKLFKNYPQLCLACEDLNFIKDKIAKTYGKSSPANMHEIFCNEEFD